MIEKVTDFFKDIKERLSNPLISSYILAWCGFNWQIVIALLFYKQTELKGDGYDSFMDLIKCTVTWSSALWWPLGSAAFYTFVFPAVRNLILACGAWYKSWGGNLILYISKGKKVSMQQYIEVKKKNRQIIAELEEIKNDENRYLTLNTQLQQQIQGIESERMDWGNQLSSWQRLTSKTYFDGNWHLDINNERPDSQKPYIKNEITISDGKFQLANTSNALGYYVINTIERVVANYSTIIVFIASEHSDGYRSYKSWTFNDSDGYVNKVRPTTFSCYDLEGYKIELSRA